MSKRALLALASAAALALAGCETQELVRIDPQAEPNEPDPALTSALEDQILVDPALTQQSNKSSVRPHETPTQAQYPAEAGGQSAASMARQAKLMDDVRSGSAAGCGGIAFSHDPAWARRLPRDFALYPGARLTDAAGADRGECRMRVVNFTTADPPWRVLGWYRSRAFAAGYSAEQQRREGDHILAGVNEQNDGAYYLVVTPRRKGSQVALIANNGG